MTLAAPNIGCLGVDLAAPDGDTNVDFVAAKAAGASFVALKRCQHVFPDATAALADKARAAGLTVMLYHFPGFGPRAATASAQVAAFDRAPGDIVPGVDLPPALDVERSMPWTTTGWDEAMCASFVDDLVAAFEDKYGVSPIVYTGFFQWDNLKRPAFPRASKCALWIKTAYRLAARQHVDQVAPPAPHAGDTSPSDAHGYHAIPRPWGGQWLINQIQGDAIGFPGFNKTVDVNVLNVARKGDRSELVELYQRRLVTLPDPWRGPLNATGVYDDDTAAAVRALQAKHGLSVEDSIGVQTAARILWSSK